MFENPLPILLGGIFITAILGIVWFQNQKPILLLPIIVTIGLTVIGVIVENRVVTPREEVEMTIDSLADALKANDQERVVSFISPSAAKTQARARWALKMFVVKKAKISKLKITINPLTSPPSAEANFTGVFHLKDRKGLIAGFDQAYPIRFTAKFRREGADWKMTSHTEKPLIGNRTF
jgi:hypothetical protein